MRSSRTGSKSHRYHTQPVCLFNLAENPQLSKSLISGLNSAVRNPFLTDFPFNHINTWVPHPTRLYRVFFQMSLKIESFHPPPSKCDTHPQLSSPPQSAHLFNFPLSPQPLPPNQYQTAIDKTPGGIYRGIIMTKLNRETKNAYNHPWFKPLQGKRVKLCTLIPPYLSPRQPLGRKQPPKKIPFFYEYEMATHSPPMPRKLQRFFSAPTP